MKLIKLLNVLVLFLLFTTYPAVAFENDDPTGITGSSEGNIFSGSFEFGPLTYPIDETINVNIRSRDKVPGRNWRHYSDNHIHKVVLDLDAILSGNGSYHLDLAALTLTASVEAQGEISGSADISMNVRSAKKIGGFGPGSWRGNWKIGDWTWAKARANIAGTAEGSGSVSISCDDLSLDLETEISVDARVTNFDIYQHNPLSPLGWLFPILSWNLREGHLNNHVEPHKIREINREIKPHIEKVEDKIDEELEKLVDKIEDSGVINLLRAACAAADIYNDYIDPLVDSIPFDDIFPEPPLTPIPDPTSDLPPEEGTETYIPNPDEQSVLINLTPDTGEYADPYPDSDGYTDP